MHALQILKMKPENKKKYIYIVYATDKLLLLNLPLLHCLPRSLYSYFAFKEIKNING